MPRGILLVLTQPVDDASEAAYNKWYDEEHLAQVLKVAGYTSARRFRPVAHPRPGSASSADWMYLTIYEVEADDLTAAHAELWAAGRRGEFPPLPAALQQDPRPVEQMFEEITYLPRSDLDS